jgi:hypothetical protein
LVSSLWSLAGTSEVDDRVAMLLLLGSLLPRRAVPWFPCAWKVGPGEFLVSSYPESGVALEGKLISCCGIASLKTKGVEGRVLVTGFLGAVHVVFAGWALFLDSWVSGLGNVRLAAIPSRVRVGNSAISAVCWGEGKVPCD